MPGVMSTRKSSLKSDRMCSASMHPSGLELKASSMYVPSGSSASVSRFDGAAIFFVCAAMASSGTPR